MTGNVDYQNEVMEADSTIVVMEHMRIHYPLKELHIHKNIISIIKESALDAKQLCIYMGRG